MKKGKDGIYNRVIKRLLDFLLALLALVILSPVLVALTAVGAIAMKGNPFFVQRRPGRIDKRTGKERIFPLIKFRTMTNEKDKDGNLLPDDVRLNGYGKFLRKTSLDELPELVNIFKGDMSLVGPRPLLVAYLPYYTDEERRRHSVRPGLTGWAQVNGRNCVSWENRFKLDVEYVDNISFLFDIKVLLKTIAAVLKHSGVAEDTGEAEGNFARIRKENEHTTVERGDAQ